MTILGIDHVAFIVKDMDKAKEFFTEHFNIEFEETSARLVSEAGVRVCMSLPDGVLEMLSVVDPVKAMKIPAVARHAVERAINGEEGLVVAHLRVDDADGVAAGLVAKGVGVNFFEGRGMWSFLPHFKEFSLRDADLPLKGLAMIERVED